jgi:cytochrome c5
MLVFALFSACNHPDPAADAADGGADTAWTTPEGDADAGRVALLNEDYVQCGVPASVYEQYFGVAPASYRMSEREGRNARLPYYMTDIVAPNGAELITTNCLYCHASYFQGEIVVGLGNSWLDFTTDTSTYAAVVPALTTDEAEKAEAEKWAGRVEATGPSIVTDTVGVNPADTLAQALFAHRDPATLEWFDDAVLPPPASPIPTDVPPLWNLRKKTASLATGSGQGNLARIMMTASALCTDDTDAAAGIYSYFPDIHAFFAGMEPPPYPGTVDTALAATGEAVFADTCARCHGTYGEDWTYDTPVIPIDEVGTDSMLYDAMYGDTDVYRQWFDDSWYGQDARLALTDGYVAPPLDGVWATAPYLHNGSVPTLRALLDSTARPVAFARSSTYDVDADIGWEFTELPDGKDSDGYDDIDVYDTRLPGYGAGGHTFGDALTEDERTAVLEYLKTL